MSAHLHLHSSIHIQLQQNVDPFIAAHSLRVNINQPHGPFICPSASCSCSFLEELFEPVGRFLRVQLVPVVIVDEVDPEPDRVAVRPLEVVQQRPREVPFHVCPLLYSTYNGEEVRAIVIYPSVILESLLQWQALVVFFINA